MAPTPPWAVYDPAAADGGFDPEETRFVRKGGRFIHAAQTVIDRFGSGRKGLQDDHEVALVRKREGRQGRRRRG